MKRKEIENRDQELIKKFRTIMQKKEKKPAARPFPFLVIISVLAFIVIGLLFLKQQPEISSPKISKTSPQVQPAPVSVKPPASKVSIVEVFPPDEVPKAITPPRKLEVQESIEKIAESVPGTPIFVQKPSAAPFEKGMQEPEDAIPGIRIEEIVSCSSVNNKQYSEPKKQFFLAKDGTVKIWMKVITENPSFTLTHVYYVNEQKYCEVPLAIRYHRMRTWSSVTLGSADHIGKWRVEVIAENGVKLDQIEFTVAR